MADKSKAREIEEKIRQALDQLGEALDAWLNKRRPVLAPVPVPVDRPHRRQLPANRI
jgi:hypothetical protein